MPIPTTGELRDGLKVAMDDLRKVNAPGLLDSTRTAMDIVTPDAKSL